MTMQITFRNLIRSAFVAVVLLFILALPFIWYNYTFTSKFLNNQEKWLTYGSGDYEIYLASNSYRDCTGGWNTVLVRDGRIIEAINSENSACPLDAFAPLTVDALFTRIWEDCVRKSTQNFWFPTCNVAYDEELGFPRRLDTFTASKDGSHRPSITVERLTLLP